MLALVARFGLARACGMGTGLRVKTLDGTATLYGKVANPVERERAEAAVRGVSGVRELWSLVRVVDDRRRGAVEVSDAALLAAVKTASRSDARLTGMRVVSVDDGVVLLSGRARDEPQKTRAAEAVRALSSGVRDVVSLVRLTG